MAKIEIGLSMLFSLREPFSRLSERLQEVDVPYVELVDDGWHTLNSERVRELRRIRESRGLSYTVHAPFADINIAAAAHDMHAFVLNRLKRTMVFARQLECALVVFHPGLHTALSHFYRGLDWKMNVESVRELLELSRKFQVELAIENCPEPYGFLLKDAEQFSRFFEEVGEGIGLALDVGHSNINGQTGRLFDAFGDRIVHCHVHDNDGKHDLHLGVGFGTVNWDQFAQDIKKIGFEGLVVVESYQNVKESTAKLEQLFT